MLLQFKNYPAAVGKPKRIFISYSHRDQDIFDRLIEALFPLRKERLVECWHDRMLNPGEAWDRKINDSLKSADLILFIVSPAFLASDYCQDTEVRLALDLRKQGKAKIVPLIARPTQWWDHELASMQALPPQARPITDFPSVEDGIATAVDALRKLLLEGTFFHDDGATGLSGIWHLQLSPPFESDGAIDVNQIIHRLVDWSRDASIRLIGYNNIPGKGAISSNIMLILEGTTEAFLVFEKAHKDGSLEGIVGYPVHSFGRTVGSTIQTSSVVFNGKTRPPEDYVNPDFKLLYPTEPFEPPCFKGLQLDPEDPFNFKFILDRGTETPARIDREQYEILLGYFTSALTIKDENWWVNLSAYESNRMIPPELAGTLLGFELLRFDVLLKQFTGSLVSPDTQTGQQFWRAVLEEMAQRGIPFDSPIETFQKVWITPEKAIVYEHDPAKPNTEPEDPTSSKKEISWLVPDEKLFAAYVTETELKVQTEWDHFAAKHQSASCTSEFVAAIYMREFNRIVVPVLHQEVNKNQRFSVLRQIYHALILATWFKQHFGGKPEFKSIIDSNNTKSVRASISEVRSLNMPSSPKPVGCEHSVAARKEQAIPVDHVNPCDDGFRIEENRFFYNQYIQLFRKGLSRCVRTIEIQGQPRTRQYFCGAIDLRRTSQSLHTGRGGAG